MREMKVVMVQQGNGVLVSCGRANSSVETDPNLLSERGNKTEPVERGARCLGGARCVALAA